MKYIAFLCIVSLCISCKEYNPEIKSTDTCEKLPCDFAPYIWKKRITDEAYTYSCIDLPIVYKNAGLVATRRNDSTFFQMIEPETGNVRWELHRKIRHDNGPLFEYEITQGYIFNNTLITPFWGEHVSGFEKIDLENGTIVTEITNHPEVKMDFDVVVSGVDSLYFFKDSKMNYEKNAFEDFVMYGNIYTNNFQKLCDLPLLEENQNDSIVIQLVSPTIIDNEIHVLIGYTCNDTGYISLYNKNSKTWVYANINYDVPWFSSYCLISYPYFFLPGGREVNGVSETTFICGDIKTGDVVWTNENSFGTYGMLEINENLIVILNYFANKIYGVEKNTGKILWNIENSMPCRYMQLLNGIVYFDTGYIYAIDAETGKKLWYLEPHDGTRFNECKVVPGKDGKKGHILASSDKHVYCFEAIK
ncbi:MAG TPA: PQQ-binding-like beta-propeller repeat protein [Bacteroidales bacterium]|nr:PQQ-binding-like beta-propeller repeat protein [Bacteroidales bacterium]